MIRKHLISIVLISGILAGCQTTGSEALPGVGFKRSLNNKSHGYQKVKSPNPVRYGDTAERFEVRPGDCDHDRSGWDDCANDRERSELSGQRYAGGEHWYAWSLYVPESHSNVYPSRVAFGQFHQEGSSKPSFMFDNSFGGLWLTDKHSKLKETSMKMLISKDDFKGKWHDIVVNVNWSKNDDGFIKVWVNDKLKVELSGQNRSAGDIYFKYGVYRRAISIHKLRDGNKTYPIHVAFYDEVRHGRSREDVDIRMIEQMSSEK